MKAINKFFYALLAFATVGMVACSEDATHEPGPAELEGCYGVYFPEASILESQGPMGEISLDPSEATVFKYYAYRENAEGEITVPVEINSTLDAEEKPMYTVEPIVFADGEVVAEFTVTLSDKAEVGVPYDLTVSVVNDPQYVKQYDTANKSTFSVTINRVKWISLGRCQFTEDLLTSWWGFNWDYPTHPTYFVEVQVRADSIDQAAFDAARAGTGDDSGLSGVYRMVNGWLVGPWGDDSDEAYNAAIAANPVYTIINAQPYNKVWIPLQEVGLSINGGMASIYSYPAALTDLGRASDVQDSMYGKIENGAITFPAENSLLGCPGGDYVGTNTYSANTDGAFKLVLSAALGTYELAMPDAESDGDFSFNEVALPEGAMFYSESQATASAPLLEKGRCEVNTKDADRAFYANYGTLYRLVEPYAEGADIYFAAKADGTVTLPKAYLSQFIGIVQNGYEVMMEINAEESTFDAESGELKLVADFAVYNGEERLSYGSYREVITTGEPEFNVAPAVDLASDFTYKTFYAVPMESTFMQTTIEDATLMKGTATTTNSALFASVYGSVYKMPSLYTEGYDIYFVADEEGAVSVAPGYEVQATGQYVLGKKAFLNIVSGTCTEQTCILNVKICDAEGNLLLPALCAETMVNLVWNQVATGTYTNGLLGDAQGNAIPVAGRKLLHAEGTNQYRITNYWGYEGYDLNFTWDKTTNKCEITGACDTGHYYSAKGGNFCATDCKTASILLGKNESWETLEANGYKQPYYDAANNTFVFIVRYLVWESGSLFSPVYDTFVLDGEVTVVDWQNFAVGEFTHTDVFWLPSSLTPPYVEQNILMQRYGETNKYRLMIIEGQVPLEFSYDASTGALEVPAQKTGAQYQEQDGSMTDIYMGDAWAIFDAWGNPNNLAKADVYTRYPNGYDAATQTYSFHLGYFDYYGYAYTELTPAVHTFKVTGAAPAATSAALASTKILPIKTYNRVKKNEVVSKFAKTSVKSSVTSKLSNKVEVEASAKSIYTATPVRKAKTPMVKAF